MKTVKVACDVKDSLPVYTLVDFQGSLKSISTEDLDKLKREIVVTGFAFPVLVWKDVKAKKNYIVGGHQRVRALRELKEDGWRDDMGKKHPMKIPEVPVVYIQAGSLQEAKRRVLQDVAQYGKVTSKGVTEFVSGAKLDLDEIAGAFRLPEINMEMLLKAVEPPVIKKVEFLAKEKSEDDDGEENPLSENRHECPRCGHIF